MRILNIYLKDISDSQTMIARKSLLIVTSHFLIQFIGWIGLVVLAKLWGGFAPHALGIIGFAMLLFWGYW